MLRNKKLLISLSIATLLFVGIGTITNVEPNQTNVVEAANKSKRLTHNAYIYKVNGKRYGKKVLKKGKLVKVFGLKKIKNKKYYRIGKNQYIKIANFKKALATKKNYRLIHNTYIYDSQGHRQNTSVLRSNSNVLVIGTKNINGKKFLDLGNGEFIKAGNVIKVTSINNSTISGQNNNSDVNTKNTESSFPTFSSKGNDKSTNTKSESSITKNADRSNSSKESQVPDIVGTRDNVRKSSMLDGTPVTASDEASAKKYRNKYIYFTDAQVSQIEARLWQDIQNYRVSKGYPAFKSSSELTKLAQDSQIGGTSAFRRFNNTFSQNTDDIKTFVPLLASQGMDQAKGYVYQNIYSLGHNGIYIGGNMTKYSPREVADKVFDMLKNSDGFQSKIIYGWKEYKAYGALSLRYYIGNTDFVDNGIGISFFTADGTSQEWVNAWQKN